MDEHHCARKLPALTRGLFSSCALSPLTLLMKRRRCSSNLRAATRHTRKGRRIPLRDSARRITSGSTERCVAIADGILQLA